MEQNKLLDSLLKEKELKTSDGVIYCYTQVKMTYNSNRLEGNRLSEEQVRNVFLYNTILSNNNIPIDIDDIINIINHFDAFDYVLDVAKKPLTEKIIKKIYCLLKRNTIYECERFLMDEYRNNQIVVESTTKVNEISGSMKLLLEKYNALKERSLDNLIDFYVQFEMIQPFRGDNGKVGRLILFKECLNSEIIPFVMMEDCKFYFKQGLNNYEKEKNYLREACLLAQDQYKAVCKYFQVI